MDVSTSSVYMLDTNTVAYILGGRSEAARDRLDRELADSLVVLSSIVQGEIYFGLEKKPAAKRLHAAVEKLFRKVQILAWDSAAAEAYGRLRFRLRLAGKSLSEMDMLIAAHAISVGAVLVTKDAAFLQLRPFLDVVDWANDL